VVAVDDDVGGIEYAPSEKVRAQVALAAEFFEFLDGIDAIRDDGG
jgi:hypothetical protein